MDYRKILRDEREKARQQKEVGGSISIDSAGRQDVDLPHIHDLKDCRLVKIFNELDVTASFEIAAFELENHRIGAFQNLFYIPDVITKANEFQLLESIAIGGLSSKSAWVQLKNRRLQSWGKSIPGSTAAADEKLPPWLSNISNALVQSGVFEKEDLPNHVLINEYEIGDGILHHTDGPMYRDIVAILSLSSPCLMTFKRKLATHEIDGRNDGDIFSVLLKPRSLLVFNNTVYSNFMHGIANSTSDVIGSTSPCLNTDITSVKDGDEVSYSASVEHLYSMKSKNISSDVATFHCLDLQREEDFFDLQESHRSITVQLNLCFICLVCTVHK